MADAMTEKRFGAVLKRLRRQRDLTQDRLARRAGLDQGYVSQLESGRRANPSIAIAKKLARALDVPITTLME
jgi:transcriptional regulator with XRE-family HTH domain